MADIKNDKNNMVNQTALALEKVKKIYQTGEKGFTALKGVNLKINRGEFLAFVGKSGSGKSTLLNLMGGIDKPTEGKIFINDKEISSFSESKLSKFRGKNIGFVFQFFQLMPTLTVLENVIMPMDFLKSIPSSKRRECAELLLDKVGILEQAKKFPFALSGGQQQRVAIARALANNPEIIMADEPTGNLDSQTTEGIFNLLNSLAEEGKTIIMVTHNEDIANRCRRVIRLKDGLIVEDICKKYDKR